LKCEIKQPSSNDAVDLDVEALHRLRLDVDSTPTQMVEEAAEAEANEAPGETSDADVSDDDDDEDEQKEEGHLSSRKYELQLGHAAASHYSGPASPYVSASRHTPSFDPFSSPSSSVRFPGTGSNSRGVAMRSRAGSVHIVLDPYQSTPKSVRSQVSHLEEIALPPLDLFEQAAAVATAPSSSSSSATAIHTPADLSPAIQTRSSRGASIASISGGLGSISNREGSNSIYTSSSSSRRDKNTMLFGGPLSVGISRSKSIVPAIVYICVSYLLRQGLKCKRLFHLSNFAAAFAAARGSPHSAASSQHVFPPPPDPSLVRAFERGGAMELRDPYAAMSVLMYYFRSLDGALIPEAQRRALVAMTPSLDSLEDVANASSQSLPFIRRVLEQLPPDHYVTLSYFLHFLSILASPANQFFNAITERECAECVANALMHRGPAGEGENERMVEIEKKKQEDCIFLLIHYYSQVFSEGAPTPFAMKHPTKERVHVNSLRKAPRTPPSTLREPAAAASSASSSSSRPPR